MLCQFSTALLARTALSHATSSIRAAERQPSGTPSPVLLDPSAPGPAQQGHRLRSQHTRHLLLDPFHPLHKRQQPHLRLPQLCVQPSHLTTTARQRWLCTSASNESSVCSSCLRRVPSSSPVTIQHHYLQQAPQFLTQILNCRTCALRLGDLDCVHVHIRVRLTAFGLAADRKPRRLALDDSCTRLQAVVLTRQPGLYLCPGVQDMPDVTARAVRADQLSHRQRQSPYHHHYRWHASASHGLGPATRAASSSRYRPAAVLLPPRPPTRRYQPR